MDRDPTVVDGCKDPVECGWVFPVTLLSIVVLAGLSTLMTAKAVTLGQVYHDLIQSFAELADFRAQITPSHLLPEGCSPYPSQASDKTSQWLVCAESEPTFKTIPAISSPIPYPDFERLLSEATPCKGARKPSEQQRFTSPTAPFTCAPEGELTSQIALADNLTFDSVVMGNQEGCRVMTIVSPGYLKVQTNLSTMCDLLIVLGGDAQIKHLHGAAKHSVRITIISSRGDIEVERVSGSISLFVAGRARLQIPPTPFLPPFPLPAGRKRTILGIAAVR